jgi:hypothetical protein
MACAVRRPQWNCHNGIATMEWPQWNCHNGMATMELPQWNCHNGIATMELPQWNCHNGIATMELWCERRTSSVITGGAVYSTRPYVFYLQFFFNCFSPKVDPKNTSHNCKHNSVFAKPMFCSFIFNC